MRLAAVLGLEAVEQDAPPTISYFERCVFIVQQFGVQNHSALQRIGLLCILRQHCAFESGQRLEGRPSLEHDNRRRRHTIVDGHVRMLDLNQIGRAHV